MREELLDGDPLPLAPARAERREVLHDAVVEAEASLLDERQHGGRGRDALREGGEVERRVHGHRLGGRGERPVAPGLAEGDLPVTAHEDDRARDLLRRDRRGEDPVEPREARGGEADGLRRDGLERRRRCHGTERREEEREGRSGEKGPGTAGVDHFTAPFRIPVPRGATPGIVTGSVPPISASP